MKRNNGFTLVELLGVIIVLGVLALIIIPNVTNTLKKNEQELYEAQLVMIEESARGYITENFFTIDLNKEFIIYLKQLQNGNYIDKNIENPKTGKIFGRCLAVVVTPLDTSSSSTGYKIKINEDTVNNPCTSTDSIVYGDVNGDGKIRLVDAAFIQEYVAGTRELTSVQLIAADVNLDGVVDDTDAQLVVDYCALKINKLPVTDLGETE